MASTAKQLSGTGFSRAKPSKRTYVVLRIRAPSGQTIRTLNKIDCPHWKSAPNIVDEVTKLANTAGDRCRIVTRR